VECLSPFCKKPVENIAGCGKWRRTPRLYCTEKCKFDGLAFKRVYGQGPYDPVKALKILEETKSNGRVESGKAVGE